MAAHIRVGETVYDFPTDFRIDEARAAKSLTGLTPGKALAALEKDPTDPDALTAMIYVAVKRGNPSMPDAEISALIGNSFLGEMMEVDDDPPAPTEASLLATSSTEPIATPAPLPDAA